jgi:hypothetical protein
MQNTQSRFVQPAERVITLSDGDTITVRRRLTAGEQLDAYQRMYVGGVTSSGTGAPRVNPLQTGIAMIVSYLLDWSGPGFLGPDGEPQPIRGESHEVIESAVLNLDYEDFGELKTAIETHEREMNDERERLKKTRGTGNGSSPTSPLPSDAAGVLIGSAP